MIDVKAEQIFPLSQLGDHIPPRPGRRGRLQKLSTATAYRWGQLGCRGVRLETVQVGGTRYTSAEAFQRFVEELTAARDGRPAGAPAPTAKRQAETAAELDAIGI